MSSWLLKTLFLSGFSLALISFSSISALAQVHVGNQRTGVCHSGPNTRRGMVNCVYPSRVGTYTNVRAIEYTGGSGADVRWIYEDPGTSKTSTDRVRRRSCVIGSRQHRQNPVCQNPFRGTSVRIEIVPHNNSWHTNFTLLPE
jgi:hypothetical protein